MDIEWVLLLDQTEEQTWLEALSSYSGLILDCRLAVASAAGAVGATCTGGGGIMYSEGC